MVAAGLGNMGSADDPLRDRSGQAAARVDFSARGDGGDPGEQQQGDQGDQARLLDARRSALVFSPLLHGANLGRKNARVVR
jgi:hypothetical protein